MNRDQTPLAIVGMACSLPGANNLSEYWQMIHEGHCAIDELPPDRFDRSLYYDPARNVRGKSYTALGAIASWPSCDLLPSNIVESSEPAHLAFCQVAAQACRNAGFDPKSLPYKNTGTYVGYSNGSPRGGSICHGTLIEQTAAYLHEIDEFKQVCGAKSQKVIDDIVLRIRGRTARRRPDGSPNVAQNQVAFLVSLALNLEGPAHAVDAACASSLIALSLAARALEQNRIEMAIVGGLSCCKADSLILFSKAQSVSATGSRPFDETADGLVVGEGCGALIVRRLDRAIDDDDQILAVIRGVGISCDGKGKSLWAPRKEGQIEAIQRAYGSRMDLSRLGYIEAHATSTHVGDATELNAISEVLKPLVQRKIPLGSVKANIGHTLETAGVAGLIKVVLAMQHRKIPPVINVSRLNQKLNWDESPLAVPKEPCDWPAPRDKKTGVELPRRGAVNSFGIGGLNAHVVLDEFCIEYERRRTRARIETKFQSRLEPIAVIGASAIFPGASNLDEFRQLMDSGLDAKVSVPSDRWDSKLGCRDRADVWHSFVKRGGFISNYAYDWRKHKVPPKQVAQADPLQFMLLDVVDQALIDAGYRDQNSGRRKTGVLIGNTFGGEFSTQLQMGLRLPMFRRMLDEQLQALTVGAEAIENIADSFEELFLERMPALLDETGSYSPSTLASRIAKTFDLMGGAFSVDAGYNSSFAAVSASMDILRGGHCDLVICACGQRSLDLVAFTHLCLSGVLGNVDEPFEEMLPGEGAGALLLKRLSDARRDGDRIRSIIRGVNSFQNENLQTVLDEVAGQGLPLQNMSNGDFTHVETGVWGPPSILSCIKESLKNRFGPALEEFWNRKRAAAHIGNTGAASGMACFLKAICASENSSPQNISCLTVQAATGGRNHQAYHLVAENDSSAVPQIELPGTSNVVYLSGTPREMGIQHGQSHAEAIRKMLRHFADLSGWSIIEKWNFDDSLASPDCWFSKPQLEEMEGISQGADVPYEAIVAHNLRNSGDISGGGCLHAAIATNRRGLLHAANEDLPFALVMRDCLVRTVLVRQPQDGLKHVTFAIAGQVCGINGMNARGLSVSSSMLLNRGNQKGQGKLHSVLIQRLLEAAADIPSAIEMIRDFAPVAANAWSICLGDGKSGRYCRAEYDQGGMLTDDEDASKVCSSNHCQLLPPTTEPARHSIGRLQRFQTLVANATTSDDPVLAIQSALRDRFDSIRERETRHPTMNTIRRVDNQISVVMQPEHRTVFFTEGSLAEDENRFVELCLKEGQISDNSPEEKVFRRFTMRMSESPLPSHASSEFKLHSAAWIVGENEVARALQKKIEQEGGTAILLETSERPEVLLAHLQSLWDIQSAGHLFLVTPCESGQPTALDEASWKERRTRSVLLPFLVAQRWQKFIQGAGMMESSTICACTSLGGDFGFSGKHVHAEGGAMSGLVKAIKAEFGSRDQNKIQTKVLDFAGSISASDIVNAIAREISASTPETEIGYLEPHVRQTVLMEQTRLIEPPTPPITPSGNWVITGGARGVTAAVAKRLGERFGVKLQLIGSSPLPEPDLRWRDLDEDAKIELRRRICKAAADRGELPIRAWQRVEKTIEVDRNLNEFRKSGLDATYYACDISDRAALERVLNSIRLSHGSIDGIVHGAGFEKSCRFEKKSLENVERTIAAKVDGAAALMALTKCDSLQAFLAFGSISGRFGAHGQTDYCLANDLLAKLVGWYQQWRPECPAVVFHWPAWGQVGMAMRPETRGLLERSDLRFMPLDEGAEFLIQELLYGLPENEVLIADPQLIEKKTRLASANQRTSLPLIDEIVEPRSQGRLVACCHLNPVEDPFLLQHVFRGRPLLPIVIGMEAILQAASLLTPEGLQVVGLRDVEAVAGLAFFTDRIQKAKIHADRQRDGIACQIVCDFHNRSGRLMRKDVVHLRGNVELGENRYQETVAELAVPNEWTTVEYPEERTEVLNHGPIFRNADRIFVDERGGWTWLEAPSIDELAGNRSKDGWIVSPGLLDSMMFSCGIFGWLFHNRAVSIPQRIGRIRLGRSVRPLERCVQRFNLLQRLGNRIFYDFALYGEDNDVIYKIEEYQSIIVQGGELEN